MKILFIQKKKKIKIQKKKKKRKTFRKKNEIT